MDYKVFVCYFSLIVLVPLFAGIGNHLLLLLPQAVQKRAKWLSKIKRDAIWERAHQRNAKRVLNQIIELEGLWVKLGQYLSTRADVLPEAYISLLKQLQDSLPPRPLEEVAYVHIKKILYVP